MIGWVLVAVPAAALVALLVHDFVAGLGEDRLWSDPGLDDPESFRNRAVWASRAHPDAVSMDSIGKLAGMWETDRSAIPDKREARPA